MKPSRTGFDKTRQHKTQQIHCPENAGLLSYPGTNLTLRYEIKTQP